MAGSGISMNFLDFPCEKTGASAAPRRLSHSALQRPWDQLLIESSHRGLGELEDHFSS